MCAMRRSIFAKSSMLMVGAIASPPGWAASPAMRLDGCCALRCAALRPAVGSNSASSRFGVDALHQVLVVADGVARPAAPCAASAQASGAICRKASTCAASAGSTGFR